MLEFRGQGHCNRQDEVRMLECLLLKPGNPTHLAVNAHDNSIALTGVDPKLLDFRFDSIQLTLWAVFGNVAGV